MTGVPWMPDGRVWVWLGRCPVCGGVMGEPDRAVMVSRGVGGISATLRDPGQAVYSCVHCWARLRLEASAVASGVLVNGGLEGPYTFRDASQVKVAEGWEAWFNEGKIRPEWQEETSQIGKGRVMVGSAQKIALTTANWDAGIWQKVKVVPGRWYRFWAHLYMWSSQQDDPDSSIDNGKMRVMVGVNPWGHWPLHYATIWGMELPQICYNQWYKAEVLFEAWADEVSLIVRGFPEWAVKHNDLYIDECGLEEVSVVIDGKVPEPEPEPDPEPGEPPVVTEVDYAKIASLTAEATAELVVERQKAFLTHGLLGLEQD